MQNTQLIGVLKSFSVYEMNSFGKFVNSPFFNINEKVIELFACLRPHYPEFEDESVAKAKLFSRLYPLENYNDKKMRDLTYELFRLVKEFLEYVGFRRSEFLPYYTRLNELARRKQEKLYNRTLENAGAKLKQEEFNKAEFYLYSGFLNRKRYEYEFIETHKDVESSDFIGEIESIMCFFIISLSYNLYNSKIIMRQLNEKFDYNIAEVFVNNLNLKNITGYLKLSGSAVSPVIEIYYNLIMMLVQDKDDGYFFELKRLVKLNSGTFNKRDLYDLYSNMESYCIRKTRDADLSFLPEQADLYKEMLSLSIFPIEKDMYFPPELYKNIVRSSIRTGEPGWGLKFIEEYTSKLNPGMRNHYYYFCLALIQFTQKRFDQSLDALAHLVTHEQMDTEQIKSLQIRLYYETDQPDAALDQIDTYRHFILNNRKISAYTRENYEPFIVFTRELIKLKYGTQKREVERREMLRDKISKAVPLANKKWLLEKLDELT